MTAATHPTPQVEPDLLTIKDLRALTQLGRDAVYELIHSGQLGHIRVGHHIRVPRAEYQRWLTKSVQRPVASPIPFSLAPRR